MLGNRNIEHMKDSMMDFTHFQFGAGGIGFHLAFLGHVFGGTIPTALPWAIAGGTSMLKCIPSGALCDSRR